MKTLDPNQIEKQYGVSGAYTGSVATPGGLMQRSGCFRL